MQLGQPLDVFWNHSWREVLIVMRGASKRDAHLAWLNAQYAAFAFNDPKNMPDDPASDPKPSPQRQEADAIAARAVLKAWASRSTVNG